MKKGLIILNYHSIHEGLCDEYVISTYHAGDMLPASIRHSPEHDSSEL